MNDGKVVSKNFFKFSSVNESGRLVLLLLLLAVVVSVAMVYKLVKWYWYVDNVPMFVCLFVFVKRSLQKENAACFSFHDINTKAKRRYAFTDIVGTNAKRWMYHMMWVRIWDIAKRLVCRSTVV